MAKALQENPQTLGWMGDFVAGGGPRYLQIAGFLERGLAEGLLSPGDRLPPQRELAAHLGVDLTTVTRALNEAKRRKLVESRGALGTFVAPQTAELAQAVDLSMNVPPPPDGLDLDDMLRRGLTQVTLRADAHLLMTYQLGGGSAPDRAAGAAWLRPMLGEVDASRVVACPGAQSALAALILTRSAPGAAIAAEPLVYPGVRLAAAQLGRRLLPVATDADGMRPDALDAACREQGVRLVYLNPTSQNPTTHTMPQARRLELARVAEAWNALIVEDDPYWLLTPDAPPPIAALAPAQTAYVATLSKCLSPGLRSLPGAAGRRGGAGRHAGRAARLPPDVGAALNGARHAMDPGRLGRRTAGRHPHRGVGAAGNRPPLAGGLRAAVTRRHPPLAQAAGLLERRALQPGGARRAPAGDAFRRLPRRAHPAQRDPHLAGRRAAACAVVDGIEAAGGPAGSQAAGRDGAGGVSPAADRLQAYRQLDL